MTLEHRKDTYTAEVGDLAYVVRLMVGRPGFWGEWWCPVCEAFRNSIPHSDEHTARVGVLAAIAQHNATHKRA